jgi:ribonuclease PH
MAQIQASSDRQFSRNNEIWNNLKYAIAASSGFQRWQIEGDTQLHKLRLEQQVQRYLRETLETLAY